MSLRIAVDGSLETYLVLLQSLKLPLGLAVHRLQPGEAPEPPRFDLVLLVRSPGTERLAQALPSRVLLVQPAPDPAGPLPSPSAAGASPSLPWQPDEASLRVLLNMAGELRSAERHAAESRALLSDLGILARLTGIEDKVQRIETSCKALSQADSAVLLIVDEQGELTVGGADAAQPTRLPQGSFLAEVARRRVAVVLDSAMVAGDPGTRALLPAGSGHALAVSLVGDGRLVGLLLAGRAATRAPFSEGDLEQTQVLGSAAAVAIDNLRLYRNARDSYERLATAQRQLLQVEKLSSLGQLSAGIAHEINNPLFVIMGNLELAIERSEGRLKGFLQKALTNAERIKRIVMDLREFYAPSKNLLGDLDLNSVVRNCIPIVNLQTNAQTIRFEMELDPDLPLVKGDDNQVLQVFTNLLLNAVQAMPDGGVATVRTKAADRFVVVEVSDTGVGIPPEHLDRVFDPFFTTKRDWTGTGLGLSVSHTIIENHQGSISVKSQVGHGSTFTVRLPASGPRPAGWPGDDGSPPGDQVLTIFNRGFRVLVVDDDETTREYIQTILADGGVESDCAESARDALERIGIRTYDMVLLDNVMPGRTGMEAIGDLLQVSPRSRMVLLTGTITLEEDEVLGKGFSGLLHKPCSRADLLHLVKKFADGVGT